MVSNLSPIVIGLGAGLLVGPSLVPSQDKFIPQELPAKSLSGTPIGLYGDGLLKGGAILGGVALAPSHPEIAGAIIAGVGIFKLAQVYVSDDETSDTDLQKGLSAAILAVGCGVAFTSGKTFAASRSAAALFGGLFLAGSALFVYRQQQANELAA